MKSQKLLRLMEVKSDETIINCIKIMSGSEIFIIKVGLLLAMCINFVKITS